MEARARGRRQRWRRRLDEEARWELLDGHLKRVALPRELRLARPPRRNHAAADSLALALALAAAAAAAAAGLGGGLGAGLQLTDGFELVRLRLEPRPRALATDALQDGRCARPEAQVLPHDPDEHLELLGRRARDDLGEQEPRHRGRLGELVEPVVDGGEGQRGRGRARKHGRPLVKVLRAEPDVVAFLEVRRHRDLGAAQHGGEVRD